MVAPWDRRSPDEQRRLADLLLSRWVPAVASYSPYWRERFERFDLDPEKVDDLDALRRLPTVREDQVAYAGGVGGPALLMRPTEEQVKATASAGILLRIARGIGGGGGPAGKRRTLLEEYKPLHVHRAGRDGALQVAYSRSDLDRLHRAGARAARVLGLSDTDYLVSAVPPSPDLGFWGLYHLALGSSLLALHPRGAEDGLEAVVEAFPLAPATAVAVRVSEAEELAEVVGAAGAELARVDTVVTVGPPPDGEARSRITHAWRSAGAAPDVKVLGLWAPGSVRALWAECRDGSSESRGSGLHLFGDLEVVELVNPITGRATDPATGAPLTADGDLTYTSAGWHGTGLLRYQTGDYVERFATGPCPGCGRTVPRLEGDIVPGAWQPAVTVEEGLVRADLRGAAAVLGADQRVAAWRLELRGPTSKVRRDRVIIEVAGDVDEQARGELTEQLAQAVGVVPHQLNVAPDRAEIDAKLAEVGGLFADLR